MSNSRVRRTLTATIVVSGAALAVISCNACNVVEREVGDRFEDHETNMWTSASDCENQTKLQRRTESRKPRIVTWNVRYFPDSQESAGASDNGGTHVSWLSCTLAQLDPDIVAVQEFKSTPPALEKQQQLIDHLNQRTGGDWKIALAPCAPENVQHPGFLYDASRVAGSFFRQIDALNPGQVCNNYASPGFGGYFQIEGGPDFHLISVHMAAGDAAKALEDRKASVSAMQQVTADAYALVPDTDIVFTGDFNTSGCAKCEPSVGNQEEVQSVTSLAASLNPPFAFLPASEQCSRQDDKGSPLLDLFAVATSMKEVPPGSTAHVTGICEAIKCERLREWYEDAHQRLSDHCPVILDLDASDDDPASLAQN